MSTSRIPRASELARAEAHDQIGSCKSALYEQIIALLRRHPAGLTRQEISEQLKIKLQTVCPRVLELREAKRIQELPQRRAIAGGRSASVLVVCQPPKPPPGLFDDQSDSGANLGHYAGGL